MTLALLRYTPIVEWHLRPLSISPHGLGTATAILAVLLLLRRRPVPYHGRLALLFGVLYGSARFVEDFLRIDETHGTGLTGSQWTAITVVALCAWLLSRHRTPDPNTTTPCSRVPRANQENRHE